MALSYYLKETGDFGVSHVEVPFLNPDDPYAAPLGGATVRDHALLAQRHLLEHRGRHGLSKIFYGDWCDTMNGVGRRGEGVSVMLTMQVKWRCDLTAELARHLGNNSVAAEMAAASAELDRAVEESAWDDAGGYCVRAFDNDGVVVGSSQGPVSDGGELRIFLNPQSWSVTSGISSGARREVCLRAVRDQLETGYGKVLSFPQSTFFKPRIGQMSVMPPGFYENGSAYTHGNCFWAAALAMAGLGDEAWDAVLGVNLKGVFHCTRAVVPHMIRGGGGVVLSASSVVGLYGNFGQTNYVATKAGVVGMTRVWARELGRYGIRVNAVAPGFVATEILRDMPQKILDSMVEHTPLGRMGRPEDIANAYCWLASDQASFVTGHCLSVDGGVVVGT